jgi:hypothetical protein
MLSNNTAAMRKKNKLKDNICFLATNDDNGAKHVEFGAE